MHAGYNVETTFQVGKIIFLTLDNTTYWNKIHILWRFFILSLQLMDWNVALLRKTSDRFTSVNMLFSLYMGTAILMYK